MAFGSSDKEKTQKNSAIMVAIKLSMEYAKLCMSMRLGNARYSACAGVGLPTAHR